MTLDMHVKTEHVADVDLHRGPKLYRGPKTARLRRSYVKVLTTIIDTLRLSTSPGSDASQRV
jgi:hypothetical protein